LAYDRCTLRQAKRFTIYRGTEGLQIKDLRDAKSRLQKSLAASFRGDKHSDRVLVRQYQDGNYVNFIVYHEQRTQSVLLFKGTKSDPAVSPTVGLSAVSTDSCRRRVKP